MDTSWVDQIVDEKERLDRASASQTALRLRESIAMDALSEDFFQEICDGLKAAIHAYLQRSPSPTLTSYPRPPDEFVIHKPEYPAGDVSVKVDKSGRRLVCRYAYSAFAGTTLQESKIFRLALGDGHPYLRRSDTCGSHVLNPVSEILADFLRRI